MYMPVESPLLVAVLSSLLVGTLATTVGALPILAFRSPGERLTTHLLAFAAGVMLAACFFSLLLPALDGVRMREPGGAGRSAAVVAAFGLGGWLVWWLNRMAPHEHFVRGVESADRTRLSRVWLFVIAIALHNLPEGIATGVGSASGDTRIAMSILLGIGMQNVPEGLAVAAGLAHAGYRRRAAFGVAALSGLVEPAGALLGGLAIAQAAGMLPLALAFAAGAMLWVVSGEVIPETHRAGAESSATAALFVGFAGMMMMDVATS